MKNSIDIKAEARKLQKILKDLGLTNELSLTQAQEVVSRQAGYRNRHEALSRSKPLLTASNESNALPKCPLCLDTGFHAEIFAGFPPENRAPRLITCRCKENPSAQGTNSQIQTLETELKDTRKEFNRIINFCLQGENRFEADTILTLWREGSWDCLEEEFQYPRPEYAKNQGGSN